MSDDGKQTASDPHAREYRQHIDSLLETDRVYQAGQGNASSPPRRGGVTLENVDDVFRFHALSPWQQEQIAILTEALITAARAILRAVPDCADRSSALRRLRLAKMEAAAAIALSGVI